METKPAPGRPRYEIDARLDLDANRVTGQVGVAFTPELATDGLVFRLWPNGPTPARSGARIATGPVVVDDTPAPSRLDGATVLRVDRAVPANATVHAVVPFELTLPSANKDRLARFGDAVRLGSWFPILAWEPSVGWATQPPTSGFAEASLSTAADFSVTFVVPPGVDVLATGEQVAPDRWRAENVPDWAATTGHFTKATETVGDVVVTVGVDRQVKESPAKYLTEVADAVRDFSTRYGAYPWREYDLAITPMLNGGIEYPGFVMQGPDTDRRTTVHEVAHQWFYALVGSDQGRDPWMDEGLATWAEARAMGTLDSLRARPIPAAGRNRMGEAMTFWETRKAAYYRSVYLQPLHALVALGIPAEDVDRALASFVRANRHKVATPKSLIAALAEVAPNAAEVFTRFGVTQ
ncbi:MAG TPA: M1 family aminopeptidase [Acidimicrobiales bacterium]|nr:M1 family aminopeptidase [Acidimicrobiales bacterium]